MFPGGGLDSTGAPTVSNQKKHTKSIYGGGYDCKGVPLVSKEYKVSLVSGGALQGQQNS